MNENWEKVTVFTYGKNYSDPLSPEHKQIEHKSDYRRLIKIKETICVE